MRKEGQGPNGAGSAVWVPGAACSSFEVQQEALQAFSQGGNTIPFSFSERLLAVPSCREDGDRKRGRLSLEAPAVVLERGGVRSTCRW